MCRSSKFPVQLLTELFAKSQLLWHLFLLFFIHQAKFVIHAIPIFESTLLRLTAISVHKHLQVRLTITKTCISFTEKLS